jgi:adenylate cyclase
MLRLILFGGLRLEAEEGPLTGRAAQKRRLALLALLAVPPGHLLSRDKLIGYLWPDRDEEGARRLLSAALYDLRRELGETVIRSPGDEVGLDPDLITSDAAEFLEALESGDVEGAVGLYGGPFLDGVHPGAGSELENWIEAERRRYAWKYREALEQLATQLVQEGDTRGAADAWRRLANEDPYNTRIALGYMRGLDAAGDRARALQFYSVHTALLREELEAEPDPEVVELAEQLREEPARRGPAPASEPPSDTARTDEAGPRAGEPAGTAAGASGDDASGEVDQAPTGQPSPAEGEVPAAPARSPSRSPLWWILPAAILVTVVGVLIWGLPRGPANRIGVAVLPFENQSSAEGTDYFADGLTEELLNALARVERFRVPARTSSFAFKDRRLGPREVGRQLNVEYVVDASVRREGDSVRVHVMLVDARSGFEIWNERYDGRIGNVFGLQETIARAIVSELGPRLAGEPIPLGDATLPLVRATTDDTLALDHYLKARAHWYERTPEALQSALSHLGQAIERDSSFARAYAAVADVYNTLGAYTYGVLPPPRAYPDARAAARRALGLEPDLAAAHAALGVTLFNYDWNMSAAEAELGKALTLDPGDVMARHWYSLLLRVTGRDEEAMEQIRAAREMDPLSPIISTSLAQHRYFDRDYDRAMAEAGTALALDSTHVPAHLALGMAAVHRGDHQRALEAYGTASRLLGRDAPIVAALTAHALGLAGDTARAGAIYRGLRAAADSAYVAPQYLAVAALGLGLHDEAVDWLEAAFEERSAAVVYMRLEPVVDPLREHPGFRQLVRRAEAAGIPVIPMTRVAGPED